MEVHSASTSLFTLSKASQLAYFQGVMYTFTEDFAQSALNRAIISRGMTAYMMNEQRKMGSLHFL